jgi:hypothetical protein
MPLNVCPLCRSEIVEEICGFHARSSQEAQWHVVNRIINDWLMRGTPLPKRVEKGLEELP